MHVWSDRFCCLPLLHLWDIDIGAHFERMPPEDHRFPKNARCIHFPFKPICCRHISARPMWRSGKGLKTQTLKTNKKDTGRWSSAYLSRCKPRLQHWHISLLDLTQKNLRTVETSANQNTFCQQRDLTRLEQLVYIDRIISI